MPLPSESSVLVINSGSSSVKFTLYDAVGESILARGIVERIGLAETRITYTNHRGNRLAMETAVTDTREAVALIVDWLMHAENGVIEDRESVVAIGHRVVHGGEKIHASVIIDKRIKGIIEACSILAPLHNPPNLKGIEACELNFPGVPQVAVFDTAFHSTLPEQAYLYGLPHRLYIEDKIRRYGFHGTSHRYVSREAAGFLKRSIEDLKMITCHLGNGSSITAVDGGLSVDTSMGLTPLEGTVMGTRCGTIDPAIVIHLMQHKKLNPEQVNTLLNRQSGFLGMAEVGSGDVRDVLSAMDEGNSKAAAAIKVFVHQIKKYLGAFAAVMNGLDAVVFTGGVGENSARIREMVCGRDAGLDWLGICLDSSKNERVNGTACAIQSPDSRVSLLVIPTDEEKEIARQTISVLDLSG